MVELTKEQYPKAFTFLQGIECDTVFAHSILENKQQGRILADNLMFPKTVVFWHCCGFANISGDCNNDEFNGELLKLLCGVYEKEQKRFVLFVGSDAWKAKLTLLLDGNQTVGKRMRRSFKFDKSAFNMQNFIIPNGYRIREIDERMLEKMEGSIIPKFYWHSPQAFLECGKGFCLMKGDEIACTVFSASISNNQIDIGIETSINYRRKGLGAITAAKMVSFCLDNNFEPIWGCRDDNIGSASVAMKLGFVQRTSYPFYLKS